MKNLVGFLILVLGLGSITAQSYNKRFAVPQNQVQNISSSDTLKILAVMVDFQEDKYDATIGTGKFGSHYTQVYGDTILDPLPHNDEYFADHLLFAKNYFKKVSGGKLNLTYKVLPEVITVSQTMREYVPGYKSTDLSPLGKFSEEVWKLADQKFSNVKFSDYDLFVIFHAGVSSGLDLGNFSIDRNMPSLYLSTSSLKNIFGTQFAGFGTKSGSIKNTLIMPETESREQTYIDNSVGLLQITINGALVANIGSHLGLPDLFDTETGKSAIGRFGLMDGQAIVANNGMFPPEPSPWEKMYLGWEEPKEISLAGGKVNVANRAAATATDTTLVKIPIGSKEYYLVENRQQDAKKDNLILTIRKVTIDKQTMKKDTLVYQKTIQKDTSGLFNFQPTDIKGGVVIDVDEYDAAVPGNGIVIWHIDEMVINSKIGENKINTDLMYKGVDVEEADGIQDIGETFSSIFGSFIGEGTKEDFWYKGNKAKFYKNSFSPTSKPNTNSNLGSNSLITIDSFSELNNMMSFNVSFGNDQQKLVANVDLPILAQGPNHYLLMLQGNRGVEFFVLDYNNFSKFSSEGKLLFYFPNFSNTLNLIGVSINKRQLVASQLDNKINIYSNDYSSGTIIEKVTTITSPAEVSSNLLFSKKGGAIYLSFGLKDGSVVETDVDKLIQSGKIPLESIKKISSGAISKINRPFEGTDNYYSVIVGKSIIDSKGNETSGNISGQYQHLIVKDANGDYLNIAFSVFEDGTRTVTVIRNGKIENYFELTKKNTIPKYAVADILNNGKPYLLTIEDFELKAYGLNGVLLENFPINIKDQKFAKTPIVLDLNNDGVSEILALTYGKLYAINPSTGKVLGGYPLQYGNYPAVSPVLFSEELPTMGPLPSYKPVLGVIDYNGHLSAWELSPVQGKVSWAAENGNSSGNAFLELTNTYSPSTDFFPTTKAYNWPNPVYGNSTKIRYYVSENSTATVKIFDLSGALVTSLSGNATGGMDNEIDWEIGKVQSGVYYANLEVVSASGKSANKIIKIAVIK